MTKHFEASERGNAAQPPQPLPDQSQARERLNGNGETTSAVGHVVDALRRLGLNEAVLSEELTKRRQDELPPDQRITGGDGATSDEVMPDVRDARVRKVLDIIESQPSQSVRRLAREAGLCPDHLQRLFKQESGGGHLRELLGKRRLHKAAQLLFAGAMSIKEIAYAVGYKHHSSFARAFQREFGQAPRSYRNGKGSRLVQAATKTLFNLAFCINIA